MSSYPRRNIYIPQELWREIRQAAEEDAHLGEPGNASEWIREACRERLLRREGEPETRGGAMSEASEQKKVWIVERGAYSDRRVVGVYSTKENAEAIAGRINEADSDGWNEADVSEWPLDSGLDALKRGLESYLIHMRRNGDTEHVRSWDAWGLDDLRSDARLCSRPDKDAVLIATVWAKDKAHAVKIANEHRTRMIATGEWPAPEEVVG